MCIKFKFCIILDLLKKYYCIIWISNFIKKYVLLKNNKELNNK
jgi:hypothetical protein